MKIKHIELHPGDDLEISFKGLWSSWNIEIGYQEGTIRVHRDGSHDIRGKGFIHDLLKFE